jgi:hypothetical protein
LRDKRSDISLTPQPFYVYMAPDNTRSCARHVCQDAVECCAIPPFRRMSGITQHQISRKMQPIQIIPDPVQTSGVGIYRHHICRSEFQHMARLATGSTAGIQDAHAIGNIQQWSCKLRSIVLDGNFPITEAGYSFYGNRFGKHHC